MHVRYHLSHPASTSHAIPLHAPPGRLGAGLRPLDRCLRVLCTLIHPRSCVCTGLVLEPSALHCLHRPAALGFRSVRNTRCRILACPVPPTRAPFACCTSGSAATVRARPWLRSLCRPPLILNATPSLLRTKCTLSPLAIARVVHASQRPAGRRPSIYCASIAQWLMQRPPMCTSRGGAATRAVCTRRPYARRSCAASPLASCRGSAAPRAGRHRGRC